MTLPHPHFTAFPAAVEGTFRRLPHSQVIEMEGAGSVGFAGLGAALLTTNTLPQEHFTDFPEISAPDLEVFLHAGQEICITILNVR